MLKILKNNESFALEKDGRISEMFFPSVPELYIAGFDYLLQPEETLASVTLKSYDLTISENVTASAVVASDYFYLPEQPKAYISGLFYYEIVTSIGTFKTELFRVGIDEANVIPYVQPNTETNGGGAGVVSFNDRDGIVVPAIDDYDKEQITGIKQEDSPRWQDTKISQIVANFGGWLGNTIYSVFDFISKLATYVRSHTQDTTIHFTKSSISHTQIQDIGTKTHTQLETDINNLQTQSSLNKGWYATPLALANAYPVGQNGWFAIVGTTDSVWVWDADTNSWADTDNSGQVTSVFGRTGAVIAATDDYSKEQINGIKLADSPENADFKITNLAANATIGSSAKSVLSWINKYWTYYLANRVKITNTATELEIAKVDGTFLPAYGHLSSTANPNYRNILSSTILGGYLVQGYNVIRLFEIGSGKKEVNGVIWFENHVQNIQDGLTINVFATQSGVVSNDYKAGLSYTSKEYTADLVTYEKDGLNYLGVRITCLTKTGGGGIFEGQYFRGDIIGTPELYLFAYKDYLGNILDADINDDIAPIDSAKKLNFSANITSPDYLALSQGKGGVVGSVITDCNSITDTCELFLSSGSTNLPTGYADGYVKTVVKDNNTAYQIFSKDGSNMIMQRSKVSGIYSVWDSMEKKPGYINRYVGSVICNNTTSIEYVDVYFDSGKRIPKHINIQVRFSYTTTNNGGLVEKRIETTTNADGTIPVQSSYYTHVSIYNTNIIIDDVAWDAVNSRFYIRIYKSIANQRCSFVVYIEGFGYIDSTNIYISAPADIASAPVSKVISQIRQGLQIGGTTNYAQFSPTGFMELFGSATYFTDLVFNHVPRTTGTGKPTEVTMFGPFKGFAWAVGDKNDNIDEAEVFHSAKPNGVYEFHVHFTNREATGAAIQYVNMQIEYSFVKSRNTAPFNQWPAATTINAKFAIPANTPALTCFVYTIGTITAPADPPATMTKITLARISAAPDTEATTTIIINNVHAHIENSKLGTDTMYV